jgi:hypothetical protein
MKSSAPHLSFNCGLCSPQSPRRNPTSSVRRVHPLCFFLSVFVFLFPSFFSPPREIDRSTLRCLSQPLSYSPHSLDVHAKHADVSPHFISLQTRHSVPSSPSPYICVHFYPVKPSFVPVLLPFPPFRLLLSTIMPAWRCTHFWHHAYHVRPPPQSG